MSTGPVSGPVVAVLGLLAVLGVAGLARSARRVGARARVAARTGCAVGRVVGAGVGIAVVQWVVLAAIPTPWVWGFTLGVPALVAGSAVYPLVTVTTVTQTRLTGRGPGRR